MVAGGLVTMSLDEQGFLSPDIELYRERRIWAKTQLSFLN